jgi:vacuolar-type H+-ATPase subunit H
MLDRKYRLYENERDRQFRAAQMIYGRRAGKLADLRDFRQRKYLEDQRQESYEERERIRQGGYNQRAQMQSMASRLPKIPDYAGIEERRELGRLRTGIQQLMLSPDFDINDPAVQETLFDSIEQFEAGVAGIARPDINEQMMYLDPTTGRFTDEAGPGRIPYWRDSREPVELPQEEEKLRDRYQSYIDDYMKYSRDEDSSTEEALRAARDYAKKMMSVAPYRDPQSVGITHLEGGGPFALGAQAGAAVNRVLSAGGAVRAGAWARKSGIPLDPERHLDETRELDAMLRMAEEEGNKKVATAVRRLKDISRRYPNALSPDDIEDSVSRLAYDRAIATLAAWKRKR